MSSDAPDGSLAPDLLLMGCGYCALALARRLEGAGVRRWGTTRDPNAAADALAAAGVTPLAWDVAAELPPPLPPGLQGPLDVVWSIPTLNGPDHLGPVRRALDAMADWPVRALVYLSATSVYPDTGGGVVDERTAPDPVHDRGRRRLETETLLREVGLQRGWRVTVARLPGIYGPGRTVLGRMAAGRYPLIDGGRKWGARIHRDDVAMGVEVLLRHGPADRAFILCDDHPETIADMVAWIRARRPELPAPPVISLQDYAREQPYAASFWAASNRYDNRAIASLPGFALQYPSFREGLAPLLDQEA